MTRCVPTRCKYGLWCPQARSESKKLLNSTSLRHIWALSIITEIKNNNNKKKGETVKRTLVFGVSERHRCNFLPMTSDLDSSPLKIFAWSL